MSARAGVRVVPYGDCAVLAELDGLEAALALGAALAADPPAGALDVVPAARTVLVRCAPGTDLRRVRDAVRSAAASAAEHPTTSPDGAAPLVLDVTYDGPDLDAVAAHVGTSPEGVVALHTGQVWTAAFAGFAPGFAYLLGEHDRLAVPRLAEPRTRVPAGAVGLAGPFTGAYPRESPGGWQLVGRTDAVLFDPDRDPPALVSPGARVRFRAVGRR